MSAPRSRLAARIASAFAAVGLLAGCVTVQGQAPANSEAMRAPHPEPVVATGRLPEPKPEVPEAARRPVTATVGVAAVGLPPQPPQRPAFPRVAPAVLDGLTAERALQAFGKPDRARRLHDGSVTTWIYEAAGCRLSVAFHFSVADNALLAHAHELTAEQAGAAPEAICLHALAGEKVRRGGGQGDVQAASRANPATAPTQSSISSSLLK